MSRNWLGRAFVGLAALALVFGPGISTAQADPGETETTTSTSTTLPAVIPSLDSWKAGTGTWTLTNQVRVVAPESMKDQAQVFATELGAYLSDEEVDPLKPASPTAVPVVTNGATSTDIQFILNSNRSNELGTEGYELTVTSDTVKVEAADIRGAFYGSRTLSQILRQQKTVPAGSIVDKPYFKERGVTLCACQINIQNDFIDRMLNDMADLKLNQILLEMKLKTNDERSNTWSYYTPEDVKKFVKKAKTYGIDVIPEINSPGHMNIWLENRPDLQLADNSGAKNVNQLDLSNPGALPFYTGLIDQYMDAFDTDYWHVGADEYMIGTRFSNYTKLTEWSKTTYGQNATIGDAFIAFVNKVNAHVKSKGKHLRMWNDGVITTQEVQLDKDIIVEFWDANGKRAAELATAGYHVMNAHGDLYWSRSSLRFKMNSKKLWTDNWTPWNFPGSNLPASSTDKLLGAKVSIWPDESTRQTENEVEAEAFESLRFISQMTWNVNHQDNTGTNVDWDTFAKGIHSIGHSPLWLNVDRNPLPNGRYTISLNNSESLLGVKDGNPAASEEEDEWEIVRTPDYYYQIKSVSTGKCLTLTEGTKHLGVVTQIGAKPTLTNCVNAQTTDFDGSVTRNPQKWQIIPTTAAATGERAADTTAFIIRHALSNQDLATIQGTERSIDFSANKTSADAMSNQTQRPANGTLVQLPPDMTTATWLFTKEASVLASVEPDTISPAQAAVLTVTVNAPDTNGLANVVVTPAPSEGWTVTPTSITIGDITTGESKTVRFALTTTAVTTSGTITVNVSTSSGPLTTTVNVNAICGSELTPTAYTASSEETKGEGATNGHIAAAFDHKPNTFWHTKWQGGEDAPPHAVAIDLGASTKVCSFRYLPRQNKTEGRIKDYELYVTDDTNNLGEKVASGSFENNGSWQTVVLRRDGQPVAGRYVILKILSSQPIPSNASPKFASAAEFRVLKAADPITLIDTDKDGVVDVIDSCPATAEGVEVDSDGCEVVKEAEPEDTEDTGDTEGTEGTEDTAKPEDPAQPEQPAEDPKEDPKDDPKEDPKDADAEVKPTDEAKEDKKETTSDTKVTPVKKTLSATGTQTMTIAIAACAMFVVGALLVVGLSLANGKRQ